MSRREDEGKEKCYSSRRGSPCCLFKNNPSTDVLPQPDILKLTCVKIAVFFQHIVLLNIVIIINSCS